MNMIKDKKNIITKMMQSPEDFLAIGTFLIVAVVGAKQRGDDKPLKQLNR